jgi:ankyrin repeat protein
MAAQLTKQDRLTDAIMTSSRIDKVKDALDKGAKVNTPDSNDRFPLVVAVREKKPRMVEFLLSRGADPNINNTEVLWYAVEIDHIDILKMLVEAGANVNAKNQYGNPLIASVSTPNKIIYLLNHGVHPNTRVGGIINTPYLFKLITLNQKSVIQVLVEKGADVNLKDLGGYTALMMAVQNNYDDLAEFFIQKGVDINTANEQGEKAIDIAVIRDNLKSVELLLAAGAKVDENTLRNFLKLGKKRKNYDMILSVLTKDQLNSKDKDGRPLLFDVIGAIQRFGSIDILKAFLEAGADVNIKDGKGYTALLLKDVLTSPALIDLLLQKGADISIEVHGANLITFLIHYGAKTEMIKKFIDAGLNINHRNPLGLTPLLGAIHENYIQYVEPLIQLGADIHASMDSGLNALHLATATKSIHHAPSRLELVQKLVQKGVDYNKKAGNNATPFSMSVAIARERFDPTSSVALYLLSLPDIDYTTTNTDTNTPPVEMAAKAGLIDILAAILAKGIDKTQKLSNGSTLIENAQAGAYSPLVNDFILSELADDTSELWRGYTQSDLVKLDTIFEVEPDKDGRIPAANVSICPICHEFVYRGEACKYMYHNCSERGHLYHKRLYDMYKTAEGRIWWCVVCGRICNGHTHYRLSSHQVKPALETPAPGADLFSDDCLGPERGGGIPEKLLRFRKLREVSKELNTQIGKLTVNKAFKKQVEAAWDAPLWTAGINRNKMMNEKKYNTPASNFPNAPAVFPSNVPEKANWNAKNFPDVVRTPVEAEGYEAPTIINGKNHGGSQNDNIPVIQFHHVRKDGTVNDHKGRYISAEYLEMWLGSMNGSFKTEPFGYCWDYGQGCTARLFPDEVAPFVEDDIYKEYKRKFNWKFAAQAGGAGTVDFFHHADNATCGLPPRKSRMGGRRKTRRHRGLKKLKRITRRR